MLDYRIFILLPNDSQFVYVVRARSIKAAIEAALKLTNHDWDIAGVLVEVVSSVKAP